MKLGYVILYVPDVAAAAAFYERAFDVKPRFVHESGDYAEMETGATALAFVSETLAKKNGVAFRPGRSKDDPPAVEVGFVTTDPKGAFARALEAGATEVLKPVEKPWGQTVAYVRDANGFLVEICTPMG
jgi:uncharacterized glyoxalase superfamily protein PhnB